MSRYHQFNPDIDNPQKTSIHTKDIGSLVNYKVVRISLSQWDAVALYAEKTHKINDDYEMILKDNNGYFQSRDAALEACNKHLTDTKGA